VLAALLRGCLWFIRRLSRPILLLLLTFSLSSETIAGLGNLDFVAHFAHVGGMLGGLWFTLAYYLQKHYEKAKLKRIVSVT